jgi:halocyanin-like protein
MRDIPDPGRRRFLRTVASGAAASTVAGLAGPASAQEGLSGWLSDVGNADSVVDRTDQDEVTVEVGTQANGGAFGFGPAVVRVSPGTTVVWEWTGEGTPHNVVAEDGAFESELISEAGATFTHAFESAGVSRYVCSPHRSMGMKGVVVVGDAEVSLGGGGATTAASDGAGAATAAGATVSSDIDYDGWFENVGNFAGTVDRTGQDEVTIQVGADGNGGNLAFSPAAVQVDPGTTVVWEWTGDGGSHDVVAEDGAFESDTQSETGAVYGVDVSGRGTVKYACTPHKAAGMKGAIVVGDPLEGGGTDWLRTGLLGLAGAIVAGPFVASEVVARRRRDGPSEPPRQPAD